MQYGRLNNHSNSQYRSIINPTAVTHPAATGKTVGRWLKDRREKKKEETRAHNAQLHAAVSVAGVAAAIAAMAAATAATSGSRKDQEAARTDMAVASAATLVAAQCVEAAEAMGADREHLASVVSSAVNVGSAGDIMTLTAAAATGNYFFALYVHASSDSLIFSRNANRKKQIMVGFGLCKFEQITNSKSEFYNTDRIIRAVFFLNSSSMVPLFL